MYAHDDEKELRNRDRVSKKTVLITGASGSLGERILRTLHSFSDQFEIVSIGRSAPRESHIVRHVPADLGDQRLFRDAIRTVGPIDVVLHFGAVVHTRSATAHYIQQVNVTSTSVLLDHLAAHSKRSGKRPLFVFASTIGVYGAQFSNLVTPLDETVAPKPETDYAESKYISEFKIQNSANQFGIRHIILRIAPSIAASDRGNLNHLRRFAQHWHILPVASPEKVWKSFVWAEDVAHSVTKCLSNEDLESGIYNLACERVSVAEIMHWMQRSGLTFFRVPVGESIMRGVAPQMTESTVVTAAKAERAFGIDFTAFGEAYTKEWGSN